MADSKPKTSSPSIDPNTSNYVYVTPFTIECGPELKPSMVHKELLCTHSPYIRDLCATAQSYKEMIFSLDYLRRELATSVQGGNNTSSNAERIKLLLKCHTHFPFPSARDSLRSTIKNQTHAQIINAKNLLPDTKPTLPPSDSLHERLTSLRPSSVRKIAEATLEKLKKIQTTETATASHDAHKAAAQDKLLLPNTSPLAVQLLIHWLYTTKLAEVAPVLPLCELLDLAARFRIARLVQLVTGRLVATIVAQTQMPSGGLGGALAAFPAALPATLPASEHPLQDASSVDPSSSAESRPGAPDPPFLALLRYTHAHAAAPRPLRKLVVETLAWAAGPEDVDAAAQWLDHDMAVRLAMALAGRLKDAREGRVESGLVERLGGEGVGAEKREEKFEEKFEGDGDGVVE